jgi:hypothetical protein
LGRPQKEESDHPRRDAQSDDKSLSISKCEIHFSDCLHIGRWIITSPYMARSQNSPTVQEHLKKQRVRFGRDMILKCNQKPYINAGIFIGYIRTVFLPNIDALRDLAVFAQEVTALLMDNYPAHVSDDVIRIPTEARERGITLTPHTTQVFQIPALTLFDVFKRRPRYELLFDDDNATVKFTINLYHDFT